MISLMELRQVLDSVPKPRKQSYYPPTLCVETKFSSKISGPFVRTPTMNSLQDSIESMDSITESRCTLCDDEISEPLELGSEFLMEHLNFLSQSTQPQEVELVYNPH